MRRAAQAGLYVHVPFCATKCPYCDFFSVTDPAARSGFVDALLAEAERHAVRGWQFDTLYLGGGTPTVLGDHELAALVTGLRARLTLSPSAELTLEVNPDYASEARMHAWRALGVTRLSLGCQSFDDEVLRFLGRRHHAAQSLAAARWAASAGFASWSLDLIYAFAGQTDDHWRRTIDQAIALAPPHLSAYQLTLEPDTPFGRRHAQGDLPHLPNDDEAERFVTAHRVLADAGYEHYEVSSFARGEAHRSQHNQRYWRHQPYLGLGPAAHSFDGARTRWWNPRSLTAWLANTPAQTETLNDEQLTLERLMLGLRTSDGISQELANAVASPSTIAQLKAEGLLTQQNQRLRPTLPGLLVADSLPLFVVSEDTI